MCHGERIGARVSHFVTFGTHAVARRDWETSLAVACGSVVVRQEHLRRGTWGGRCPTGPSGWWHVGVSLSDRTICPEACGGVVG